MIRRPPISTLFPYTTLFFFFFNDTATTEIYTLSLHDALPICRFAKGAETWRTSTPVSLNQEIERFHTTLTSLDEYLASDGQLGGTCERLFQGAISDSLTHVGQLTKIGRAHV